MNALKVWFPEFFTEAHRRPGTGWVLVEELAKLDVFCTRELSADCDFIFCGGTWMNRHVEAELLRCDLIEKIPIIHYCWDLYPFNLSPSNPDKIRKHWWQDYLSHLKQAHEIWVPSQCTVTRVKEFTGRDARVLKTSVRTYEKRVSARGMYVVDVMRKYPDPNEHAAKEACDELGITCYETNSAYPWEEFKQLITNATLLISAYEEASTGGLTLLEGYYHGVPVLCSNSPRNGAVDYFGDRADYFQWNDGNDLTKQIARLCAAKDLPNVRLARGWLGRKWIDAEYSEAAFAQRIATRLRELKDVTN